VRPSSVETTLAVVPAYDWPTEDASTGRCGSLVAIPPILDVVSFRQRSHSTTNHHPLDSTYSVQP
jgi:hypothetical protein